MSEDPTAEAQATTDIAWGVRWMNRLCHVSVALAVLAGALLLTGHRSLGAIPGMYGELLWLAGWSFWVLGPESQTRWPGHSFAQRLRLMLDALAGP